MKKLDRCTVRTVELTAPGACPRDEARLHCELTKGRIFGGFTEEERENIWRELLAVSTDRLIPSLYTFFEDARYLRGPAECVKRLVEGSPGDQLSQMVKNSFTGVNQQSNICIIQVTESQLEARPGDVEDQVEMGYRHWWYFAMRDYDNVPVRKRKAAGDRLAQPAKKENMDVLSKGATLVNQIGFETRQIRDLVQHPTSCDTGFVPEVSSTYKQPKRCGIPRSEDQQRDKPLLFADALHRSVDTSAGVTSFFVRRSVYLAFFGHTRRLVAESSVINRVLILSTEQTDRTKQLDDTHTVDTDMVDTDRVDTDMVDTYMPDTHIAEPETEQVERTNLDRLQEEMESDQVHERTRLPQLSQDFVQECHEVGQPREGLHRRQTQLQLFQEVEGQQKQDQANCDERQEQLIKDLAAKERQSKEQYKRLQTEQDNLEKQQQDQLAQYLNTREEQNKKQQDLDKEEQMLQAEQQHLAVQNQQRHMTLQEEQQRLDKLTNDLAIKVQQNQQRYTTLHDRKTILEKQEQELYELVQGLDKKEEQNQQRYTTLHDRKTILEKQEQELHELVQGLDKKEEQNQQRYTTLHDRKTILEKQEQELHELVQGLDKKEEQNQQRYTTLHDRKTILEQQEQELHELVQGLDKKEEQNQQRYTTLHDRKIILEKQEHESHELVQGLDKKEEQNQQRYTTLHDRKTILEKQEQELHELTQGLDKKEEQNQQRQSQLEKDQQEVDKLPKTLKAQEQNQIAWDEQRYNGQQELFEQEQDEHEQDELELDLDARKETDQSSEGEQQLQTQQRQLEQSERGPEARGDQLTQEEQQAQEPSESVARLDTLSDQWREEYNIQTPAWKQLANVSKEGRPITQIGPEKSGSIEQVERDIFMQSEQEGQASTRPGPERQDLAHPALHNSQEGLEELGLLTHTKGRKLDPDPETEEDNAYMSKKLKLTQPEDDPSQRRTAKGIRREYREIDPGSLAKSKRITQVGGLTQQQAGHSKATVLDTESSPLPVYIQFKIFKDETWVRDQAIITNARDPEPIRTEAEKYRNKGMTLFDKEGRMLSIQTCMEDVLQDGTNTIFLCRPGEKMHSTYSLPGQPVQIAWKNLL
jgi:hypothetical protein